LVSVKDWDSLRARATGLPKAMEKHLDSDSGRALERRSDQASVWGIAMDPA
jgi:hypothetical protein